MHSYAKLLFCALGCAMLWACAAPGQVGVQTPQGRAATYPPTIEADAARQQAAAEAWRQLLAEYRLPEAPPDWEPVLFTPRALPAALAGKIHLNPQGEKLGETEAKEALRSFIERARVVLSGSYGQPPVELQDLSLITFTAEGGFYRAVYQQAGYPFPIANGYGELRLVMSKDGALLQMSSRLAPKLDLPARAELAPAAVADRLVGRQFTYANVAGQPMSYRVAQRAEINVKDLVVYPKLEGQRLAFHLAYQIEVGRGMTWTVYIDAITGQELGVRQNFAT